MTVILTPEYNNAHNQIQSFRARLNELKQLRERSSTPELIKQANRVNQLVQDLLATQQSLFKDIGKLNYGKNYRVGQNNFIFAKFHDLPGRLLT